MQELSRTALLIGEGGLEKLKKARVLLFGIGGVGGYVAEALGRAGVGHLTLVDHDTVSITNLNRQIIALHSTVGRYKTEVMRERLLDIRPDISVEERRCFYLPENADTFDFSSFHYVVDAVDTVTAKVHIIQSAKEAGVPVISCMGTGNKLHPELFCLADMEETYGCPLARIMRRELKKRNLKGIPVVYSPEKPIKPVPPEGKRAVPGSISFTPPAAGLILAGEVVRHLINEI